MDIKNVRNLIFDLGGVLLDLNRPRCIEQFRRLGLTDIERMLDVSHQQEFFLKLETGQISSDEFRDCVRHHIGRPVSDEAIDEAWNSFLVGIPAYKLDLLLELRKDYVVYLLSNTNAIHWEWACRNAFAYKGFRAEDYFEQVFLSYEMQLAKPNPAIYRQLLDETGIRPEETLFIDDSPENCSVAQTLFGISTYCPKAHEDWSHLFR